MSRITLVALTLAACGLAPAPGHAQRVPFFSGGNTGFDPEISVVNSGVLLDVQPVVSNDLKYVTINTRASNARLLALREFQFARGGNNPPLGFVGDGGRRDAGDNLLRRRGTSLVSRLRD
jgi:hypothetical protein